MLAGSVMAASRNASRWLTIWPIAGATIRIDMDMETDGHPVADHRDTGVIRKPSLVSVRSKRANTLTDAVGIDHVHGDGLVGSIGRALAGWTIAAASVAMQVFIKSSQDYSMKQEGKIREGTLIQINGVKPAGAMLELYVKDFELD